MSLVGYCIVLLGDSPPPSYSVANDCGCFWALRWLCFEGFKADEVVYLCVVRMLRELRLAWPHGHDKQDVSCVCAALGGAAEASARCNRHRARATRSEGESVVCLQEECSVDPLRVVDALVTVPGCPPVAVEVDGVHHCIAYLGPNGPLNFTAANSWPDGATQLRDWTLKRLGYRVANVMFYDVSPKALKQATDQAQQPHNSIVQAVARIVRSEMSADAQQPNNETGALRHTESHMEQKGGGEPSAPLEVPSTSVSTTSVRADEDGSVQVATQGGSPA